MLDFFGTSSLKEILMKRTSLLFSWSSRFGLGLGVWVRVPLRFPKFN